MLAEWSVTHKQDFIAGGEETVEGHSYIELKDAQRKTNSSRSKLSNELTLSSLAVAACADKIMERGKIPMAMHSLASREQVVRSLMQGGRYASEDEVIDEALRLLEERDEQAKLDHLRREIAIGIEQVARGETVPFNPQATLERVRSQLSPKTAGA